ncbi:MAG: asparagine synthetase B, partial [Burkholderiales bacterium]|nr:asparagine synthetase B [Burkholderiales bacterium]
PLEYLVTGKQGKRPLRHFLSKHHGKELLNWPKSGFGIPLRDHFATNLKKYLTATLTAPHPVYDTLVRRDRIPELIERHARGRPFMTRLLLQLLSLRLWIESSPVSL